MKMKFSVLMSVYHKDNPKFLEEAIDSVLNQTVTPNEIVVVKDGILSKELNLVLDNYVNKNQSLFKIVSLEKNRGLGLALREGINHCSYEYIARMDSDDICIKERFEKQLKFLSDHKDIDVLGGWILEFNENIKSQLNIRKVPVSEEEISKFFKKRNPMNHVTVMLKKESVLKADSYKDFYQHEDYYLWARMLKKKMKFYNLQENLVYVRVGNGMYERRGGLKYLKNDISIQKKFYIEGLTSLTNALKYVTLRLPVRLIPNSMRAIVYKNILRVKVDE